MADQERAAVGPAIIPVKLMDIGYITAVYFVLGFAVGLLLNAAFGPFDPQAADRRPAIVLASELVLHFWLLGMITYVMRNLSERIPSPLHGVQGLDHWRVKEVGSLAVFTTVLMWNQRHLVAKMIYLNDRLSRWLRGAPPPPPDFAHPLAVLPAVPSK